MPFRALHIGASIGKPVEGQFAAAGSRLDRHAAPGLRSPENTRAVPGGPPLHALACWRRLARPLLSAGTVDLLLEIAQRAQDVIETRRLPEEHSTHLGVVSTERACELATGH